MNVSTSTRTLFCAAGLILTTLLSACGGSDKGRDPILGIPGTSLVSVAVTPATATVAIGATQQYTATASFADGSTRNVTTVSAWTAATPAIGTVGAATGLATGVSAGTTAIKAVYGSQSGSASLTVLPSLIGIRVLPADPTIVSGTTQQFTADGVYSNGTYAALTTPIVWSRSAIAVATISPTGLATGVAPGDTIITATSGALDGNAALHVIAPPPVPGLPPVIPPPPAPGLPPVIPPVIPPVVVVPVDTVPLGNAARFAVLAGTSLTNNSTITTVIGGDVGSPSQTVPPTVKPGFQNYVAGPELTNGLADLSVAITNANARACTFNSASGVDLGGKIMTPGVYCYDGAISITGTLILNGPGVYIFRTKMTLDTVANAVVATVNADPSQVFWVPVGATTLGANGHFKGSILGQAGAITVGDTTDLFTGRVLSRVAVTLASNKIDK